MTNVIAPGVLLALALAAVWLLQRWADQREDRP